MRALGPPTSRQNRLRAWSLALQKETQMLHQQAPSAWWHPKAASTKYNGPVLPQGTHSAVWRLKRAHRCSAICMLKRSSHSWMSATSNSTQRPARKCS